jgi:hypothetical protein
MCNTMSKMTAEPMIVLLLDRALGMSTSRVVITIRKIWRKRKETKKERRRKKKTEKSWGTTTAVGLEKASAGGSSVVPLRPVPRSLSSRGRRPHAWMDWPDLRQRPRGVGGLQLACTANAAAAAAAVATAVSLAAPVEATAATGGRGIRPALALVLMLALALALVLCRRGDLGRFQDEDNSFDAPGVGAVVCTSLYGLSLNTDKGGGGGGGGRRSNAASWFAKATAAAAAAGEEADAYADEVAVAEKLKRGAGTLSLGFNNTTGGGGGSKGIDNVAGTAAATLFNECAAVSKAFVNPRGIFMAAHDSSSKFGNVSRSSKQLSRNTWADG